MLQPRPRPVRLHRPRDQHGRIETLVVVPPPPARTDIYAHAKIFTWDAASGVRLFEEREPNIFFPPGGVLSSSYHQLVRASVSGDGSTVALAATDDCINFTMCALRNDRYRSTIRHAAAPERTEPEFAVLSANGRFALLRQSGLFPRARVLEIATGISTLPFEQQFSGPPNATRQIANNGTTIQPSGLRLWPSGELRPLPVANCAAINAAATRAFCLDQRTVSLLDLPSGGLSRVFTAQGVAQWSFDISETGDEVVFLDSDGLWFVRADGSALRRLAGASAGIAEFVLSGNGNIVFAATAESRLLRFDIAAAAMAEIVPAIRAILFDRPFRELAKGAAYEYRDAAIPEIAEVRLPGTGAPRFQSGPELVAFQVPFGAPSVTGWPEFVIAEQGEGPFVSSVLPGPVAVVGFAPFWYLQGPPPLSPIAALHQDFRGPVTVSDPARPGEIIHVYGGGFGPVDPVPTAGQPAPASPLSQVTQQPLACDLNADGGNVHHPVDVVYAGLAPGWIGLYQLDLRIPEIPAPPNPARFPTLRCGIPNSTATFGFLPYTP